MSEEDTTAIKPENKAFILVSESKAGFEGKEEYEELRRRLKVQKGHEGAVNFLAKIREWGFGKIAVAWRQHFENDGDRELHFKDFCIGLASLGHQGGDAAASSDDFFDTLPRQAQEKPLKAAQWLQWLQLASTNDPFADDSMYNCSLCSEPLMMEATVTTPCNHHFHRVCINRIDSPQCPLCGTSLPFSWFLPADHPCAEHGFRTVTPRSYRPCFAGGPSKGSCGYPLQRPPPARLRGANGSMRSYLHRLIPTVSGVDANEDEDNTPDNAEVVKPIVEEVHEEDDESSSDSNSEDELHEEDAKPHGRQLKQLPVYLYSAVGRMKQMSRRGMSGKEGEVPLHPRSQSIASQASNGAGDNPRVELFTALFGEQN